MVSQTVYGMHAKGEVQAVWINHNQFQGGVLPAMDTQHEDTTHVEEKDPRRFQLLDGGTLGIPHRST